MKHDFQTVVSGKLCEKYYIHHHKSGLNIYIYPKNFQTSYAIFATKYGSLEQKFRVVGEKDFVMVPAGVAHFLEHKMFEEEDGSDAFEKFAPFGAQANAYTSYDKTAYLFSCSDINNVVPSLEVLLSFVTHPHFTKENVEKEQGIIGQEIGMTDDRPGTRLHYALMNNLYGTHGICVNICGTVTSISEITPEILYRCYNTFYNLSNMALCYVGPLDPDTVLDVADRILPVQPTHQNDCIYDCGTDKVLTPRTEMKLTVSRPLFSFGIRDKAPAKTPEEREKRAAAMDILLELILSKTSRLHNELYDSGLIPYALSADYDYGNGYAHVVVNGESDNPEEIYDRFFSEIDALRMNPPSEEDFIRIRRAIYASDIRMFDDTEEIGDEFIDTLFSGIDIFRSVEIVSEITYADILELLNTYFDRDMSSMAIIYPV